MASVAAFIAANRFVLGAKPGELAAIDRDPRAGLSAPLDPVAAAPAELTGLPDTATTLKQIRQARRAPGRCGH